MTPIIGEFLGTLFLILLGGGVVANVLLARSKGQQGGWITITAGWGIAVMVGVFVAQSFGSPNADLNPAISLARHIATGSYTIPQMFALQLSQVCGAFLGAVIVWLAYLPHWRVTEDPFIKLLVFSTQPAIRNYPCNLLNEIIGTAVLVIGVAAIFGPATKNGMVPLGVGPYLVGMLVWGIGLSLGGPTGYAINPARDLGPRIAHAILPLGEKGPSDWSYALVPIIGPLLGAIIGAIFWKMLAG